MEELPLDTIHQPMPPEEIPELSDGTLSLSFRSFKKPAPVRGNVGIYEFDILLVSSGRRVGRITAPIAYWRDNEYIQFYGNVGYRIEEHHRGHRYAATAVTIILPFLQEFYSEILHNEVLICCYEYNIASKRTCEIAGGELMDIVLLPDDHYLSKKARLRFRWKASEEGRDMSEFETPRQCRFLWRFEGEEPEESEDNDVIVALDN